LLQPSRLARRSWVYAKAAKPLGASSVGEKRVVSIFPPQSARRLVLSSIKSGQSGVRKTACCHFVCNAGQNFRKEKGNPKIIFKEIKERRSRKEIGFENREIMPDNSRCDESAGTTAKCFLLVVPCGSFCSCRSGFLQLHGESRQAN
jgi:hypothetical protein